MSRHPARLAAVVCILIFGMWGSARAEDPLPEDLPVPAVQTREPVAVIELGNFEPNRKLALDLAGALNNSQTLKPLDSLIDAGALRDEHKDEDKTFLDEAEKARTDAEADVVNYKFPEAARNADKGLAALYFVTPSPRSLRLSAELAFLFGSARLGERKPDVAATWFRVAYALDPNFKPDPIRYLPEIVQAFEVSSRSTPGGKGWLEVSGPGRVFLDGKEIGTSPQTFPDITPGIHVVQLVGDDRDTHGKRVEVVIGKKADPLAFGPGTIDRGKQVKRARRALKNAPDPAARAAAMQHLARLVGVRDAVLLSESNGKTIVQTWRDQAPGFSSLRELKDEDKGKPGELLTPFLPPKPVDPPRPDRPCPPGTSRPAPRAACTPTKIVDTRSWYQKPSYRIGGGVVGAVIIGIAIYSLATWDRTLGVDQNPGFTISPDQVRR